MLRYVAGAASALLLATAGFFVWTGTARDDSPIPPPPSAGPADAAGEGESRPATPPAADPRGKEQRRFDRADGDKDGRVTLTELYLPRRRAFVRLDGNSDGMLSFEEWAVRTATKFGEADADRSGALSRGEYAATAPRQRPRPKGCAC